MMRLSAVLVALLSACDAAAPPEALEVLSTSVDQISDHVSPTARLTIHLSLAPDASSVDQNTVMIVEGIADRAWLESMAASKDQGKWRERLRPGRVELEETTVHFIPTQPLAPLTLHTLVVTDLRAGRHILPRPVLRSFTTGAASIGAAVPEMLTPSNGASDVPRNLRAVEVAFSRPVENVSPTALFLASGDDIAAATLTPGNCPTCYLLLLSAPLRAHARYQLWAQAPICDEAGQTVFVLDPPPSFATGEQLRQAPPSMNLTTIINSDGCLVARWQTDIAASSRLCLSGACTEDPALTNLHELSHPLPPGETASVTITSRDPTTAPVATLGPFAAPASSPRQLVITEVLTRPLGAWPTQQFVEIYNYGPYATSLGGLELRDEGGADALPDVNLAAGGFALIVPSTFSLDGPDPSPAEGTVLARISKSRLGKDGIRTSGEQIEIAEADGRPVSRFSSYGLPLAKGQSAVRRAACDLATSYAASPSGSSSPGEL